jgi:hypothetical protein
MIAQRAQIIVRQLVAIPGFKVTADAADESFSLLYLYTRDIFNNN